MWADLDWIRFAVTLLVAAVWGVLVFFLPFVQKLARLGRMRPARSAYETLCVIFFAVSLVIAAVQAIPLCYYAFLRLNQEFGLIGSDMRFEPQAAWVLLVNLVTFLSARGLLWRRKETATAENRSVSFVRKTVFLLLASAGPVLLLIGYFLLCHLLLVSPGLRHWR